MTNKTYDVLKYVALIAMPALATFVLTVGRIWGVADVEMYGATITATGVFLGALLQISSANYKKEN